MAYNSSFKSSEIEHKLGLVHEVPTLDHVPTGTDLSYTDDVLGDVTFNIGDKVRYYDTENNRYLFYVLKNITDGVAEWYSLEEDILINGYYNGYNSVTSLDSIPVDKRLVVATVSADETVSLADTMTDGRELHIIINNSGSSSITVTLPDSSTLDIEGDSFGEVNIIYAGGTQYIRSI